MKGFEDVTLAWKGQQYVIPANRMLMLVAQLEDILRGRDGSGAVQNLLRPGGPSVAQLSQGFGCALRYAGASVTDDEVYLSIVNDFAEGKADVAGQVQGAILAMIEIIAPPVGAALRGGDEAADVGEAEKKP